KRLAPNVARSRFSGAGLRPFSTRLFCRLTHEPIDKICCPSLGETMSNYLYLILGGIALLLVIGVVIARVRKQRALPGDEETPRLTDARRDAPSVAPERATLD